MLSLLNKKFSSNNIGSYRDNLLSVFRNVSGRQAEKHKKTIQKIFKDKGLQIIVKRNLKIVDYLDVTLKEIFENSKDYYVQRLRQCACNEKLTYTEENNQNKSKIS